MPNRITSDARSTDYIVSSSLLITMLYTQHGQLLKHGNFLFWAAIIFSAITAGVFVAGAWCAVVDPTGISFHLLVSLLKGAPFGLVSGGLFCQYNKLQRQASELCTELSRELRLASALVAAESIEDSHDRDVAHLELAQRLVTRQSAQGVERGELVLQDAR